MAKGESGWFPDVAIDAAERRQMVRIATALRTKADKIRALAAGGFSKQKIASFLDIRYQHVRNVLVRSALGSSQGPKGFAEPSASPAKPWVAEGTDEQPIYGTVVIDEQGRIALPANVIAALGGEPSRPIPWRFEDGELKLMNQAAGVRFAQAMCADLAKEHRGSWADELIAERRAEAARDDEKDVGSRRG